MSGPSASEPPRIAVVLVHGVGDERPGATTQRLGGALARLAPEPNPEGVAVWRPVPAPSFSALRVPLPAQAVQDRSTSADGVYEPVIASFERSEGAAAARVDLIEMHWADISRMDRGLVRLFATLFELALQFLTPALEVLRQCWTGSGLLPRSPGGRWWGPWAVSAAVVGCVAGVPVAALAEAGAWWGVLAGVGAAGATLLVGAALDRRSLPGLANGAVEALAWWIAVLVIPATIATAAIGTALWLMVDEPLDVEPLPALAGSALAAFLALWAYGRAVVAGGWRFGADGWALLIHPRLLVFLPLLGAAAAYGVGEAGATSSNAAASRALLLTAGFGLRGVWIVALALVAVALIVTAAAFAVRAWASKGWPAEARRGFGTAVLGIVVGPFLVAQVGLVLVGGIGAYAFTSAEDASWKAAASEVRCLETAASRTWSDCDPPTSRTLTGWLAKAEEREGRAQEARADAARVIGAAEHRLLLNRLLLSRAAGYEREAAALRASAAELERKSSRTPADWARNLFVEVVGPLAVAIVVLLGLLGLLGLLVLGWSVAAMPFGGRDGKGSGSGRALTRVLRVAGSTVATLVLLAAGLALAAAGIAWWGGPGAQRWISDGFDRIGGDHTTALGGGVAALVLLLLFGLRLLAVDPRKRSGEVTGGLERMRLAADVVYDVASYVRREWAVRRRTIARLRALLDAARADYDEVVIAAHSQGSVYVAAALAGDEGRREPAPVVRRPHGLVTFGCPLRQTYETRFPGQYSWPWERPEKVAEFAWAWVNVYRARDYVGRAVFRDPLDVASHIEGTVHRPEGVGAGLPDRLDACLRGSGDHTGYWGDLELARWIDRAAALGIARLGPDPPEKVTVPAGYGESQ